MNEERQGLEEALAFVERHVEQLDDVVRELHDRVDGLTAELERVRRAFERKLDDLAEAEETRAATDEPDG